MFLKRFRPYFNYLKPVKVQFGVGLLAGLIYAASSGFGLPYVTKYLVPLVTQPDKPEAAVLFGYLALVPIMFTLRALGSFVNAYFIAYSGMYVLEQIRRMVFDHIQRLPLAFFHKNKVGDLMSRTLGDTTLLQTAVVKVVDSLIKEPATLLAAGAYLVYLSFQAENVSFILLALASIPACVLPIRFIGQAIVKKATLAQAQAGELNHVLNENLSATREVRAYNLEAQQSTRFAETCARFFKQSLKVVKYDKALTPIIEVVTAGALVGALYIAIQRDVDEGALASILVALYMCYRPTKKIGNVSNTIRQAEASLNRLEYILDTQDTVPDAANPTPLKKAQGDLNFENVAFQYADEAVLQSVHATIPAGQTVALVGPSGAGKTTFANLVPRFYDVAEGCVRIDGLDVRQIAKADLRRQIALVSQEAVLFGDTIANNIRLGNPNASDADIEQAARMAHAHDFIEVP
jgi:subfamily B ATP-binding cassette protein MsbA